MDITLSKREALLLYRILSRNDDSMTIELTNDTERQLFWDLECILEKELEPVTEDMI